MNAETRHLFEALAKIRVENIKKILDRGCDLEATNDGGDTPLDWIISMYEDEESRNSVVEMMLQAGADVNHRQPNSHGYAISAIIQKDLRLLRLLLKHGYDPNLAPPYPESDYNWAVTDYILDHWENGFPEAPTENETSNPDRFLGFLERLAKSHQVEPPVFLRELRDAGALTYSELQDYGME